MTITGPYVDLRRPGVPYVVSVRHGCLVEVLRFPTMALAEAAVQRVKDAGAVTEATHTRPRQ